MFSGFGGIQIVDRTEGGGGDDQNLIAGVDDIFVGFKTPEDVIIVKGVAFVFGGAERFGGIFGVLFERVADGDHFAVVFKRETVLDRAAGTAAAADQTDLDTIITGSLSAAGNS